MELIVGAEEGEGLGLQAVVVAVGLGGEAGDEGGDVAVEDVVEEGQGLEAEAVAAVLGGGVAGVVAELEAAGFEIAVDLAAAEVEQGADEMEAVVQALNRPHAAKTCEAAAAAEIGEDGFRLVVGVMGEDDDPGVVLFGHAEEEVMARLACGSFDGDAAFFGEGCYIGVLDLAGELVLFGELLDEGGVAVGFLTAQAVVEVAEDEVGEAGVEEQMQEGHGVATAGEAEQGGFSRVEVGREVEMDGVGGHGGG